MYHSFDIPRFQVVAKLVSKYYKEHKKFSLLFYKWYYGMHTNTAKPLAKLECSNGKDRETGKEREQGLEGCNVL